MARYVLVSFDDNAAADDFVKRALAGSIDPDAYTKVEVWGMYMKPTQFCECKDLKSRGDRQSRGAKFGLWIDACGKPIRGHWQYPRNLLIAPEDWQRLPAQQKAAFHLGTREGVDLSHVPITSLPNS